MWQATVPTRACVSKVRVVMTLSRGDVVYRYGADDPFADAQVGRGQFVPGTSFDYTRPFTLH